MMIIGRVMSYYVYLKKYCLHRKRMTILFGNNKILQWYNMNEVLSDGIACETLQTHTKLISRMLTRSSLVTGTDWPVQATESMNLDAWNYPWFSQWNFGWNFSRQSLWKYSNRNRSTLNQLRAGQICAVICDALKLWTQDLHLSEQPR